MPETIRELYDSIVKEGREQGLSGPQRMYAVGWILHDVFERASHDEKKGIIVTAEHIDRYAAELPDRKIARDIEEAQDEFGRVAAAFMDEEIQSRIKEAIDTSIITEIKNYTSGIKTFFWNVAAGVISGLVFAIILIVMGRIYENDPSPIQVGNMLLGVHPAEHAINPPVARPPSPAPPK